MNRRMVILLTGGFLAVVALAGIGGVRTQSTKKKIGAAAAARPLAKPSRVGITSPSLPNPLAPDPVAPGLRLSPLRGVAGDKLELHHWAADLLSRAHPVPQA